MKRRSFIYLSVAGTLALGVPGIGCRQKNEQLTKLLAQPKFLSHICDEKTLKEIGKAYKEQFPSEHKESKLTDLLMTDDAGKPIAQTSDQAAIDAKMEKKIKEDFEQGEIVVVKGWVLSATEARQCALFSLS